MFNNNTKPNKSEIQSAFNKFHLAIKLNDTDDNEILREKRDLLVNEIRKHFKDNGYPTFSVINQGSYAMGTGIRPKDGESYDIDIALLFNISKRDYPNPFTIKKWVYEALAKVTTRTVIHKKPCVRVEYSKGYDVDIACFANNDYNKHLAIGTNYNNEEWKDSEPKGLLNLVENKCSYSDDRQQFKRIIRYLKRWRDEKFKASGNSRPTGIALTSCALAYFSAKKDYLGYNDIDALLHVVIQMINNFYQIYDYAERKYYCRLQTRLSVPPKNDLFEKMTNKQMEEFRTKLCSLKDSLERARLAGTITDVCKILRTEFGSDFPLI